MPNGILAQESQAAVMGPPMGGPPGGAGPAGLTQGQGPPPPAALGGQQPAGAAPQAQPTPGFPEMCQQLMQILSQGNEADMQIFGQTVAGPLSSLVENHQSRMGQGMGAPQGAAPPGPVIP